ncbi:MAG: DUF1385 domain-containing protein [Chloroflexi bacterium]|nr:DUF1385 domain-containing protein [Chloroflexota bacterium]
MIRGQTCVSVAVRRPNGEILVTTDPLRWAWAQRLRRIPLLRGFIVLAEMLAIGTRSLMFSARIATEEDGEGDESAEKQEPTALGSIAIGGTLIVSMAFAIGIFFALPVLATHLVDPYLDSALLSNIAEGVIRLALFVAYIGAIGFMPDIRRVYSYHGAEHMVVHAREAGQPLTIESVRRYSTAHPRCGTAFILVVMVIAIGVHALLGAPPLLERILSRIVLLPIIAGVSYEIIRWSGFHAHNPIVRAIIAPNLLLQAITTKPPQDDQIEVAIRALEGAVEADRLAGART